MHAEEKDKAFQKFNNAVEKYALFVFILLPYLLYSFSTIRGLILAKPEECGTGYVVMGMGQIFFAVLVTLILGLKMFLSKGYGTRTRILIFAIIFIPLIAYMALAQ